MTARDDALKLLDQTVRIDGPQLARYAWGVIRNCGLQVDETDVLQDIVGDAVLTATQIIRSNDGRIPNSESGVKIWLRKIVSLKALERIRKIRRDKATRASLDDHISVLSTDAWTDLLAEDEFRNAVSNAVGSLAEREQQVLEMSVLDGATSARIGQELQLSANAVRKIKMRALKTLRKHLENLGA